MYSHIFHTLQQVCPADYIKYVSVPYVYMIKNVLCGCSVTSTAYEKMAWMESLLKAIQEYEARRDSLGISEELLKVIKYMLHFYKPMLVKLNMCNYV